MRSAKNLGIYRAIKNLSYAYSSVIFRENLKNLFEKYNKRFAIKKTSPNTFLHFIPTLLSYFFLRLLISVDLLSTNLIPQRCDLSLKVCQVIAAAFSTNVKLFCVGDAVLTVHALKAPGPGTTFRKLHVFSNVMDLGFECIVFFWHLHEGY